MLPSQFYSKKNRQGHSVIRLHYSADPAKNPATENGKAWFEKEASKYMGGVNDLKWRREMEIDFSAGSGELVFPWFMEKEGEFVIDPPKLNDSWTLYGALDWGTRNPTAFEVYAESPDRKIVCVWELYVERMSVKDLARNIRECPFYSKLQWIAGDPTLWSQNVARQDGFTSIAEMLNDPVITGGYVVDKLMPAHGRSDETAIILVTQLTKDARLFFSKDCGCLISELRSLKYPERKEFQNETEKIQDKNNHAWDTLKYFLLSHPDGVRKEEQPKFGSQEYLMEVADYARQLANNTGQNVQDVFYDLYGQNL